MRERVGLIVGRRIRDLRQAKGWSQEKLAEEADLDRTYIGRIERGEKNIGVENLVRIAQALGSSAADVLRGVRP
jgi:transcriptional regulator with XRE-family HTH domain